MKSERWRTEGADYGTYHLTLYGYLAEFDPPVPYPQTQNTMNHAVYEGSAIVIDS